MSCEGMPVASRSSLAMPPPIPLPRSPHHLARFGSPLGNMKENAIIHNHQLKNLDPNMVFHVERDGNKDLDVVYTYACLGHGLFSFNVLAKTSTRTTLEIESMIAEVSFGGELDCSF